MSEDRRMEARLSELEIKISFAEDMIDGLNRTVYRQQQQIDRLLAQVETLRDQVQAAAPAEQRSLRDELPPHY
jgi:SlyX protein